MDNLGFLSLLLAISVITRRGGNSIQRSKIYKITVVYRIISIATLLKKIWKHTRHSLFYFYYSVGFI